MLSACAGSPQVIKTLHDHDESKQNASHHQIFIAQHNWHTSITIQASDIQNHLSALKQRFKHAKYLSFGWGEENIYQADEVHFFPAAKAILLPSAAVVHVVVHPTTPRTLQQFQVVTLCLEQSNYKKLLAFISSSFKRNQQHQIMETSINDSEHSQFYEAKGTYYFLNTCNTWVGKALASAGFNISPVFRPTASQIMAYLKSKAMRPKDTCEASRFISLRAND